MFFLQKIYHNFLCFDAEIVSLKNVLYLKLKYPNFLFYVFFYLQMQK